MQYFGAVSKRKEWALFICKANHSILTVIQVYASTTDTEEAQAERFYDDLQDLLELTPKNDVLFIIGDWNAKAGSQEIPGVTGKFGLGVQNEAGQRLIGFSLPREHTCHRKHPLLTTQETVLHMTSPDGQYWNQINDILYSQRWRSSQDWELTAA